MSYSQFQNDRGTPIRGGAPISAGETAATGTRALWIGTGGTLVVTTDTDDQLTFQNMADGVLIPIHVKSVDVGTTCTDMIALV